MKKLYFFKLMLVLIAGIGIQTLLRAQNVTSIDIDKYKNSFPANDEYSARNAYAYLNGYSYFTADDGNHGRELWRTDGTAAGTKLVKDVNPGSASSDVYGYDITVSGGKLFFAANGGSNGFGLWVSDGTNAGTQFITDVSNGAGGLPSYLTDVNGTLFFAVSYYDDINTFTYVNQVWKRMARLPVLHWFLTLALMGMLYSN